MVDAIRHGGGPQLYNAFHEVPPPVVHATTNNPLGLFLSTLLPWATIPNAPAVGGDQNQWYDQLMDFLQGYVVEENQEGQQQQGQGME